MAQRVPIARPRVRSQLRTNWQRTGRAARAAALVAVVVAVAACSSSGSRSTSVTAPRAKNAQGDHVVTVEMRDISYSVDTVTVPADEPIEFVFRNVGKAEHEAFLGDAAAQALHESEMSTTTMAADPSMPPSTSSMDMDSGGVFVAVAAGKTGSLVHAFHRGDTLLIGCHEPGHYQAGMKIVVRVA